MLYLLIKSIKYFRATKTLLLKTALMLFFSNTMKKKNFLKDQYNPKIFHFKEEKKNYENHLKLLSETKLSTDKFFDKVKVNDENQDLKNNRLELLQILCSTFNSFIDFSKLEGA